MKYGVWCETNGMTSTWANNGVAREMLVIRDKFDYNNAQFFTSYLNAAYQYLEYLNITSNSWIMCVKEQ